MPAWPIDQKKKFRDEHQLIMPVSQPRHNLPHDDLKTYFNTIFAADCPEYKGMVTIAAIDHGSNDPRIVAVVPADKLGDWASQMHVSTRMNYYYGRAQHSGNATWGCDNSFAFNTICVDIDNHTDGKVDLPDNSQHIINAVSFSLPDRNIPMPNIVECSGRGYHLVWLLNQVPACLDWMVRSVALHYAEQVKDILSGHSTNYRVDMGYSSNIAGLTRIPGTWNTLSRSYSTYELRHTVRVELAKAYDSIKTCTPPARNHTEALGQARVSALLQLARLRHDMLGYRHNYCLQLFSAAQAAGMNNSAALELTQAANASFSSPLSEREVQRSLSTAARKHYKFTTARIIEALDISEAELQAIGLCSAQSRDSNRARNARRADKRAQRDKAIMRLHLLGKTFSEIAKHVHHAYNTVVSVVRRYETNLSALFTPAELARLRKQVIKTLVASLNTAAEKKQEEWPFFKNGSHNYYAYTADSDGQLAIDLGPPPNSKPRLWHGIA